MADFVGDSLGLSQQAAKTNADVIVFCGVHFMAETAKILNPKKIVVLPDKDAGCSLEEDCPADQLAALQKTNPNFWTVAYINCSAAVKALSDVIVHQRQRGENRRGRAEGQGFAVRAGRKSRRVGDGTDRPADDLVAGQLLRACRVPARRVLRLRAQFPDAKVVVHPESLREVRDLADAVCSTEKMITLLQERSGEAVRHRDRIGHHPPDAEGMSGQRIYLRADL